MKALLSLVLVVNLYGGSMFYGSVAAQWAHLAPITTTNATGGTLTAHQINIALGAGFEWSKARADCSDIRVGSNATTGYIPYWIETCSPGTTTGSIWAKVPSLPNGDTTLYLYYGNNAAGSGASGNVTFEFFDDFTAYHAPGYWATSAPVTFLSDHQVWEITSPHMTSLVDMGVGGLDGFRYWLYYGLLTSGAGAACGVARSNDLASWTKYTSNPILTNCRWPTALLVGSTVYLVIHNTSNGHITLLSATDGLTFSAVKDLVATSGNGNPNLFKGDDGKYYLYWYAGLITGRYTIKALGPSDTVADLDAATNTTLLTSRRVLAAPNMLFYGGVYHFTVEVSEDSGSSDWNTWAYTAAAPLGPFTMVPGNPILGQNEACHSQNLVGTTMFSTQCYLVPPSTWTLQYRIADVTSTPPSYTALNPTKWPALSGARANVLRPGFHSLTTPLLAMEAPLADGLLFSSYTCSDCIWEARGMQKAGRSWGSVTREVNANQLYVAQLYEDLDATGNEYLYKKNTTYTALDNKATGNVVSSTWYLVGISAASTALKGYKDYVEYPIKTDAAYSTGKTGILGQDNTLVYFNLARARKWASAEPTSVIGDPIK
jgi:hypothetical protein